VTYLLSFGCVVQATDELILAHVGLAILLACLPIRVVVLAVLLEFFTRSLEFRREQTERHHAAPAGVVAPHPCGARAVHGTGQHQGRPVLGS